ncbi:hypothetical protein BTJ68_02642 [Hortaea werneckii EXF-2000]|uniref:Zn(2)-C6 fungal-type domain-containing protein n=2 Tax=Hortaea werneckii TaxID=91943 RepID=A0A3M7JBW9_HORWE|nr:hypothetical protein BTJ68_02642 [Hortaea werneckii EXF-2000]RMZ35321.1 hypothetical protein D0859_00561 [Hortaea werneckii]
MPEGTKSTSLSYKGCWTCRDRRVKCDEQLPSCQVCHHARIPCAGYSVRLVWNAEAGIAKERPRGRRRRIEPGEQLRRGLA